jgi:hypothetical protein
VNTLITEPGTVEVEWYNDFAASGNYVMPSLIRFTREGPDIIWGRTEYSIGFDTVSSVPQFDECINHFSDRVTIAATRMLSDGKIFDFAVAPSASFFLRDEQGTGIGDATGWARRWGGRRLATGGAMGHLTPHMNVQVEKASGMQRQSSAFEGIEYQIAGRVALEFFQAALRIGYRRGGSSGGGGADGSLWQAKRVEHLQLPAIAARLRRVRA